jgi:hypothetical protein
MLRGIRVVDKKKATTTPRAVARAYIDATQLLPFLIALQSKAGLFRVESRDRYALHAGGTSAGQWEE